MMKDVTKLIDGNKGVAEFKRIEASKNHEEDASVLAYWEEVDKEGDELVTKRKAELIMQMKVLKKRMEIVDHESNGRNTSFMTIFTGHDKIKMVLNQIISAKNKEMEDKKDKMKRKRAEAAENEKKNEIVSNFFLFMC